MLSTIRDARMLRDELSRHRLSQRQLAARITEAGYPVSHQRVAQLCSGEYPNCHPELALHIEHQLGVETGALFSRIEKPPRSDKGSRRS